MLADREKVDDEIDGDEDYQLNDRSEMEDSLVQSGQGKNI